MLALSSTLEPLGKCREERTICSITDNPNFVPALKESTFFLSRNGNVPTGFLGYLFFQKPDQVPENSYLAKEELSYLCEGDVVRINPKRNAIRVIFRKNSNHNSFLVTERCNNFCLMCSQPPKEVDDSYIAEELLEVIPKIPTSTGSIGITGGEPTLLGDKLFEILKSLRNHVPHTSIHILSNGRNFKDISKCVEVSKIQNSDLMIGIPVYSDISELHDYVVQADGAFDETIRGIINLKSVGVKVELRVVIHKSTYNRLPQLAEFIRRNLTFVDQVALMGLEMMGFTKINLEDLWIDPKDYQNQLKEAVFILSRAKIKTCFIPFSPMRARPANRDSKSATVLQQ